MSAKENVSKAIEMLEHHQLRKLMERAKAGHELSRADLKLLERLKSEAPLLLAGPEAASKKTKRGRPTESRRLAEKIERLILEKLQRQERGEKLTGADYAFLEKVKQTALEKAEALKVPPKKPPLSNRLQDCKEVLFENLIWVVEHSKSHMARVSAAQALRTWADQYELPLEPYVIVDACPQALNMNPLKQPETNGGH